MKDAKVFDFVRQALNVLGAIAQVGVGALVGPGVGDIANENRSIILPSGYAFSIWSLIFLLFAVYAVYQALPAYQSDPLLRAIGPWTAATTIGNGVWTLLFPNRLFVPAQLLIIVIAVCAVIAVLRYAGWTARHEASSFERWVIGPAVGLLGGWITAATFAGLAGTLVALGWDATGPGAALGGAGLVLFGGGAGVAVLVSARWGEPIVWLAYGAAVVWALIAIAVNNAERSGLVAGVALATAATVVVLLALLARVRDMRHPARGALA